MIKRHCPIGYHSCREVQLLHKAVDKSNKALEEAVKLKEALEWCARALNEIGQAKGLVADHGDALDNALEVLNPKPKLCLTCGKAHLKGEAHAAGGAHRSSER